MSSSYFLHLLLCSRTFFSLWSCTAGGIGQVVNRVAYVESYSGKYLPNPQLPHLLPKRTSAPFRLLPDYKVVQDGVGSKLCIQWATKPAVWRIAENIHFTRVAEERGISRVMERNPIPGTSTPGEILEVSVPRLRRGFGILFRGRIWHLLRTSMCSVSTLRELTWVCWNSFYISYVYSTHYRVFFYLVCVSAPPLYRLHYYS